MVIIYILVAIRNVILRTRFQVLFTILKTAGWCIKEIPQFGIDLLYYKKLLKLNAIYSLLN